MAVKLSPDQERVIREVWKAGDEVGASPMERVAAIETIGVEANYKAIDYGDRDSVGPFQQRTPWGSKSDRIDPYKSALKFYEAAKAARQSRSYKRAGDLAADVQRPAEQYRGRYNARRGEALAIINQLGLNGRGGGGGAVVGAGTSLGAELNGADPAAGFDASRGMLSALEIDRPQMPTASAPAPPAAAAGPTMPQQYPGAAAPAASGAPQAPEPLQLDAPQDYSTSFGGTDVPQLQQDAAAGSSSSSSGGGSREVSKPRVKIAAGANVAGKPIDSSLLGVLDHISATSGRALTVTTGTNHSKYTTNGNVSEHYVGRGADLAMRGKELTDTGVDALLSVGRGKKVQWLRNDGSVVNVRLTAANTRKLAEAGGIFNVPYGDGGRVQVILNTHQGGDHTNHLHVGYRPGQ